MSEVAVIVLSMVWLGLGGFAFAKIPGKMSDAPAGAIVFVWLVWMAFGPAVFGYWLATRPSATPNQTGEVEALEAGPPPHREWVI